MITAALGVLRISISSLAIRLELLLELLVELELAETWLEFSFTADLVVREVEDIELPELTFVSDETPELFPMLVVELLVEETVLETIDELAELAGVGWYNPSLPADLVSLLATVTTVGLVPVPLPSCVLWLTTQPDGAITTTEYVPTGTVCEYVPSLLRTTTKTILGLLTLLIWTIVPAGMLPLGSLESSVLFWFASR